MYERHTTRPASAGLRLRHALGGACPWLRSKNVPSRCNQVSVPGEMRGHSDSSGLEADLRPLWACAQAGDEAAYRQALGLMAGRLRSYFKRRMPSLQDDVEDLVQETLLAVHLQRGTYDPAFAVCAWFTAIGKHKLVDLWRRRGRLDDWTDAYDDSDPAQAVAQTAEPHSLRDLERLLEQLPALQRQAIVLTKLEGLALAEASARTGVSIAALKVQVHRGLKRLAMCVRDAT